MLTELQNRGVKDIFIVCVDELSGFPEALESVYPQTRVQLCMVHLVRNSLFSLSDEAVFKVLYLAMRNIAKKWTMPIRSWKPALNRFAGEFADRFPK